MGIPFIIGASQQKKRRVLGFETFVAPDDFDRTAQDVDIYDVFERYYRTNNTAKYIYSMIDSATTWTFSGGTSYRYGYTDGGIDYVVDLYNNTQTTQSYSGATTTIKVVSTAGFPATGILYIGTGQSFTYTSVTDGTTFTGASQSITQSSGAQVYCSKYTITWSGTKRWAIVNHVYMSPINISYVNINGPVWIYCGHLIYEVKAYGMTTLKYIHIHDLDTITYYGPGDLQATGITGHLYLSPCATTVSYNCFTGCIGITGNLNVPGNNANILNGGDMFRGCTGITSLTLNEGITKIAGNTFSGCTGLTGSLTLPTTLTTIGYAAFFNTRFTGTLTIPANVTSIGEAPFYNNNFSAIDISANPSRYHAHDDVLYQESNHYALYSIKGNTGTITLENDTAYIGQYCFASNSRTGVLTIPASVISLNAHSFEYCSGLTGLTFTPTSSCTTIVNHSFQYCTHLKDSGTITFPASFTTLYDRVFYAGALPNLVFDSATSLSMGAYTFQGCGTFSITYSDTLQTLSMNSSVIYGVTINGTLNIPNTLTTFTGYYNYVNAVLNDITGGSTNYPVIDHVMYDKKTSGIVIACVSPKGYNGTLTLDAATTSIAAYCFDSNSRTGSLTIPTTVTSIGASSFQNCTSMTGALIIPNNVTSIGASSFQNCRFSSLSIGTGITSIPSQCFYYSLSLGGTLTLHSGITAIASGAFGHAAFTRVDSYPATAPTISGTPFDNDAMALHVPTGGTGYNVAPWTTTAIFATKTADL